ncbi:MAG TPA: MATE family efflux transporter [Longimicrobiales bacterium]|nr:MATE family efflux transporter [Longimicrobiales bacterium]
MPVIETEPEQRVVVVPTAALRTAPPVPVVVRRPGSPRTRLLLEGPIVSTLLRLAAPNVVVNVVLIAVTASVDAYFLRDLGPSALAGLALVFPLLMLMQQVANSSMGGAVASAVARAIGAGRRAHASALVVHALVIALAMAAIFTTVVLAGGPIVYRLMGGSGQALAAAVEYSNVIFAGALAYWVLSTLTSIVRGAGQAAVLGLVYVAAEAVHILLVPVLVFGIGPVPALGITGAGIATVVSFTLSALALVWYLAAGRTAVTLSFRHVHLDRRVFAEILRVGAPMSLQPIFNNLTLVLLTGFVGTLGPTALAGFGAAVRLEYVQTPLVFGLGAGLIAMVGTNVGAGQIARASRITWTALALAVTATAGIGIFALVWPELWGALFSASPAVQMMAASYLCVVALACPFLGLGLALSSAFQAVGRPMWPVGATAGRALVVGAGGWIAIHWMGSGVTGLALVAAAGMIVYGSTLAIGFGSGAWRSAAIVKAANAS